MPSFINIGFIVCLLEGIELGRHEQENIRVLDEPWVIPEDPKSFKRFVISLLFFLTLQVIVYGFQITLFINYAFTQTNYSP